MAPSRSPHRSAGKRPVIPGRDEPVRTEVFAMYRADDRTGSRDRKDLEALLLPLVHRALRRRTGPPALVVWVERSVAALAVESSHDSACLARTLTPLLCDLLLQQAKTGSPGTAETVRGR